MMRTSSPLIEVQGESLREFKRLHVVQPTSAPKHAAPHRTFADWSLSNDKRIFDVLLSSAVLLVFGLPMLLIAACIRLTSRGPAIFVQKRVGQGGRLFSIYKFRSMTLAEGRRGCGLTKSGDHRVTWIGKYLRRLKLDELPQFYNVLRGDMSIVGPRPKLPEFADDLTLAYRPGITGAASLAFCREEDILASVPTDQVESFYHERIKPLKASIDARYAANATFRSDLRIVFSTMFASLNDEHCAALQVHEVHPTAPVRNHLAEFSN
jgi:lipopolysaccharide/colanic/teichoic acid biosynthesis glycosyltransferase